MGLELLDTVLRDQGADPSASPDRSLPLQTSPDVESLTGPARRGEASDTLISDIQVGGTLAQGGVGWIRAGYQPSLSRPVAIKTALGGSDSEANTHALLREAMIAGRLDHPNIVPIHALGYSKHDGPFILMKRVEGVTLDAALADAPPAGHTTQLSEYLERLVDICRAVEYAHSRGVLHCDIKPGNIMVGDFAQAYLLDWGSAILPAHDRPERQTELLGTPAYMPPEAALPERVVSEQTDVYLLGGTLYQILEGRPPRVCETVYDALEMARAGVVDPCSPDTEPDLAAIVARACAAEPSERYASVAALRADLESYLERMGSVEILNRADQQYRALREQLASGAEALEPAEVRRRLARLVFAYTEYCRQWPESPRAVGSLRAALLTQARFELQHDNLAGAEAAVATLDELPEALQTQLAVAREQAARRKTAPATLESARADERLAPRDWTPTAMAIFVGLLSGSICAAFGVYLRQNADTVTPLAFTWLFAAVVLWNRGFLWFIRNGRLLATPLYRRFATLFECMFGVAVFATALAALAGYTVQDATVLSALIGTAVAASMVAVVDRNILSSALFASFTSLFAAVLPSYGPDVAAAGFVLTGIYLAWALRPGATAEAV